MVSGYPSSCVSGPQGSSLVVDQSLKFKGGLITPSQGTQSPSIHRCFPKGLGCSLEASNSQWSVESGGIKATHKHSKDESSVSSFKIIQRSDSISKPAAFHTQIISGCLSEQAGRHSLLGDMCTHLENHALDKCQGDSDSGKTHPKDSPCCSTFLVKKRQGDSN